MPPPRLLLSLLYLAIPSSHNWIFFFRLLTLFAFPPLPPKGTGQWRRYSCCAPAVQTGTAETAVPTLCRAAAAAARGTCVWSRWMEHPTPPKNQCTAWHVHLFPGQTLKFTTRPRGAHSCQNNVSGCRVFLKWFSTVGSGLQMDWKAMPRVNLAAIYKSVYRCESQKCEINNFKICERLLWVTCSKVTANWNCKQAPASGSSSTSRLSASSSLQGRQNKLVEDDKQKSFTKEKRTSTLA